MESVTRVETKCTTVRTFILNSCCPLDIHPLLWQMGSWRNQMGSIFFGEKGRKELGKDKMGSMHVQYYFVVLLYDMLLCMYKATSMCSRLMCFLYTNPLLCFHNFFFVSFLWNHLIWLCSLPLWTELSKGLRMYIFSLFLSLRCSLKAKGTHS